MFRNTEARYYVKSWDGNSARSFGLYVVGGEGKKCFLIEMPLNVFPFSWSKVLRWAKSRTTQKGTQTHFLEKLMKGYNFFE
jgi:hypothetical protein